VNDIELQGVNAPLAPLRLFSRCHKIGPDDSLEAKLEKSIADCGKARGTFCGQHLLFLSERKSHTQVDRMVKYNTIVTKIMEPKGYKMIDTFDMSATFPYDPATVGWYAYYWPTMKMVVTKLLHYMWAGWSKEVGNDRMLGGPPARA
jgi:hypothetical protein